jgi:hypothetical protein
MDQAERRPDIIFHPIKEPVLGQIADVSHDYDPPSGTVCNIDWFFELPQMGLTKLRKASPFRCGHGWIEFELLQDWQNVLYPLPRQRSNILRA